MPDIVITPNRGTSTNPKIDFTGVTTGTIKLEVLTDGSLSFNGANGSLFSIADSVTGSLMSVNDTSGLPILEVFSTDKVVMGKYGQNTLVVDGTNVGIGTASPTSKFEIRGGTANQTNDATLYVTADNDNDWAVVVDKWRSNATEYGLRVITGSAASYAFAVYGNGSLSTRIAGNGDIYAPRMYDSTATAYYVDPGSTSNLNGLTVAATITGNAATASSAAAITGGIPSGTDYYINLRVIRNNNAASTDGMYIGYGNAGSGLTRLYGGGSSTNHAYVDVNGDIWRSSGGYQYVYNSGTWSGVNIGGNAATATTLQTARNIAGVSFNGSADITLTGQNISTSSGTAANDIEVAKYLRWKNYGNNHILIDASAGTNPGGGAIDRYTPGNTINSTGAGSNTWGEAISLMGWNGSATYGVRVDRARSIDNQANSATITAATSNTANQIVLRDGSGNIFGQEIYASGWFRSYGYQGIYNQDYQTHFYAGGTGYYNLAGNSSATDGGLIFRSGHQSTIKGRVYWDGAGFGLLNDSGNWAVRSNYGAAYSGGSLYGAWDKRNASNTGGITVPGVFIQSGVTSGAPSAIQNGDLWWNTDTGKLKIYWSSASAWVDATPVPDMAGYYTTGGGNINGNVNVSGLLESTGNITARIGQTYPVSIGSHPSYSGANYGALWRPGSNPVLLFDASNTYVNAPSLGAAVSFQVGNTTHAYVNSNGVTTNGSFIMSGGFTLSQTGGYGQTNNWIHLNGYHGLYSTNNSAHIYPNNNSSYGAWSINGSRNSWGGIYDAYSGIAWMGDAGGNGGLYRESNGRWYIYHNTAHNCTAIGSSNTTSGYAMQVTGSAYVTGSVNIAGNTAIHAGNYNSYAPTLTGGGASGSWGISVTGTSRYLAHIDGPRNLSDRNPNWSARTATFDFIGAGTAGTSGNYAGVLTFVPWDGTTGSTGDASYQLAFGSTATNGGGIPHLRIRKGIDTTWNSWYTIPIVGVNTGYQSSIYVDTFYDQGDTNYYLDPSGTSRVNTVSFVSGATFGPYLQYNNQSNLRLQAGQQSGDIGISGYDFNGNWKFQLYGDSSGYGFLNGNWAGWDLLKSVSGNLYLNNQSTYYIGTNEIYYNRVYGVTDIRSPIFYDNNDTAYYIDPTSGQANSEGGKIKWNFTVNGEGATSGRGLALYPSYTSSVPTYGITFAQTASLGTHGNVTADWATYFTMNNTANRGWIFRDGNTPANVASINNAGRMRIASLGVNTDASATNGEIRATDNITAYYSDERLKTRLGAIENPIEKIKSLSGFYFEANETAVALGYQKKREVGVSAQEVQAILPEIIAPAPIDDKYMTVRYEKLIPLLIEAIKAQQAQIEELQKLIKEKV